MKITSLIINFLVISSFCYSDQIIYPTRYCDQEEVLVQGGQVLVSRKANIVSMYQTSEIIKNRKANFYFEVCNNSEWPINLYFENLRVTDQYGRRVRVVRKKNLIDNKKSEQNWKLFNSAVSHFNDVMKADDAAKVKYHTDTHTHFDRRYSALSTQNDRRPNALSTQSTVRENVSERLSTSTQGTIHNEAVRQQFLRQAEMDAGIRNNAIQNEYLGWQEGLSQYYFDSNTIYPNTRYGANIQIKVPRHVEKELRYLIFTFDVAGEAHSFCFYCEPVKTNWFGF